MLSAPLSAQEFILPLQGNPQLSGNDIPLKKSTHDVMLELPVSDDFSGHTTYPDPQIWADDYAFVNNGYAVEPPTIGVATLDAVDRTGTVYPFASISPLTFDADLLTSHPVNLNYPASDSIYLSFFYQPQGTGLQPFPEDSLCLDFYDPVSDAWYNVWRVPGDTLRAFEQVMIPVDDTLFLKEGFRFGFRNRASLPLNNDYRDKRGNVDHWNIDYVRLDRNRNYTDTVIRDVAFRSPPPSMLNEYESVPWDHIEAGYNSLYLPFVKLNYFNNDTASRNVTRYAEITDETWGGTFSPGNPTTQDILPGTAVSYNLSSFYPFDFSRGDTARFRVKAWLRTDEFDNRANDTVYRIQRFRDYFAYDDGSAERAYGLRGQGTNNGLIAVRFNSFIADELGGVDIYFTQLKDSLNLGYYFKFMVWGDDEGKPGDLIYEDDVDYSVVYGDILNRFVRFEFDKTVPVSGTFYVGLMQYNQYLLNIGMDINKPASNKLFYNIGTAWDTSAAPGTLMIRPFVQRSYSGTKNNLLPDRTIRTWPNPANDHVMVELPVGQEAETVVTIYGITGQIFKKQVIENGAINTSGLPQGIYLFSFNAKNRHFGTRRIIIQR